MALGSMYKGSTGEVSDTLNRVAFKMYDANGKLKSQYNFAINPQRITDTQATRNVFTQTSTSTKMQGYGAGLHTIQITGTTGVNQVAVNQQGAKGKSTGYTRLVNLKKMILSQINNAHDAGKTYSNSTSLYFCNYTNEQSWLVEMDTDGIQISQSSQDPLSYYYTISMVVLAEGSVPKEIEQSSLILGNTRSSLSSKTARTTNSTGSTKSKTQSHKNMYSNVVTPKSTSAVSESDTGAKKVLNSRASTIIDRDADLSINSLENKLSLDSDVSSDIQPILETNQVSGFYKLAYKSAPRTVHIVYGDTNLFNLKVDSSNSSLWDAYWEKSIQEQNANTLFTTAITSDSDIISVDVTANSQTSVDNQYALIKASYADKSTKDSIDFLKSIPLDTLIKSYGVLDLTESYKTISQKDIQDGYKNYEAYDSSDVEGSKFLKLTLMYNLVEDGYGVTQDKSDNPQDVLSSELMGQLYSLIYGTSMVDADYSEYLSSGSVISDDYITNYANGSASQYSLSNYNTLGYALSQFDKTVVEQTIDDGLYRDLTGTPTADSDRFLNPLVSNVAPSYAYSEINNVLQVD